MAVAGLTLCLGTLSAGWLAARSDPTIRRAQVQLRDWPTGARPIRIILLSDIHLGGSVMTRARLARIVRQVNTEQPDLVLLTGDFVNGHAAGESAAQTEHLALILSDLRSRLGTLAVLGNHDHWTSPDAIRTALRRAGVTVLDNEAVRRGPVTILGIGDIFSGHGRPEQALAAAARLPGALVAITHSPDLAPRLPAKVSLLLAGHTHCGQVVLPGIGPLLRRGPRQDWRPLYEERYRCGLIREGGRTIVVTAGVGAGSAPIRIGAPPDLWVITVGGAP